MKIFQDVSEIAITEDDLIQALEEWLGGRFKPHTGCSMRAIKVSNIKHCRSSTTYALRFNAEEP